MYELVPNKHTIVIPTSNFSVNCGESAELFLETGAAFDSKS